jgi:hypothetical protein
VNEEIELYTKKIIDYFNSFINCLKARKLSMGEKAFYNHVKKIVTKIVNNNNQYILTDDIIWYITHTTSGTRETDYVLLSKLGNFIKMNESDIEFLYSKYIEYLVHSKTNIYFRYNIDSLDVYLNLMDERIKHIVLRTIDIEKELEIMPGRLRSVFYDLLLKYAIKCALTKDTKTFDSFADRLYNNIPRLYERLLLNGIITTNNRLTKNFDKYLELEFDNDVKEYKIR